MVASPIELCSELGYRDGIDYLPSRGPPELLLDELKAFLKERPFSESGEALSAAYLASEPAGLKHEPPETACQLGLLSWPEDDLMLVHT